MSKPILEEKDILNPNEAIELFVLSRKLIIRSEFQKYLDKHPELKRRGS